MTKAVGKITVKHYLNTTIERVDNDINKVEHPIYILITANRKTTRIKSLTNIYYSKKEFDEYVNNSSFKFDIPNIDASIEEIREWGDIDELRCEIKEVEKIIDYCIREKKLQIGKFKTSEVVDFYSKFFDSEIGKRINHLISLPFSLLEHPETSPIALYLRLDVNPYELLFAIKQVTNFDVLEKLDSAQKEIIMSFNEFVNESLLPNTSPSKLIHWYNGDLKRNYLSSLALNKTNDSNRIVELLDSVTKGLETNFWKNLQ